MTYRLQKNYENLSSVETLSKTSLGLSIGNQHARNLSNRARIGQLMKT